ncbi:hypothetical protein [Methylocystis parvus]|uniref:hypothetical protein n=1 Tax=Methylocystis parvus TaxID=134 RepID=UPI003C74CF80
MNAMHKLFLAVALVVLATAPAALAADKAGGRIAARETVWKRVDCGPYGHRGPWGGCIPGGEFGAGNYWLLGPNYVASRPFLGPRFYGAPPTEAAAQRDYGPAYWGARDYGIPAFW